MARGRGRGPTRSNNRRPIRSRMRQISRAISFEPRRIALPPDPPPVKTSFHFNTILPFDLALGGESTGAVNPGLITFKFANQTASWQDITVADLWKSWLSHMIFADVPAIGSDTEISVLRVAYWGPSASWLTCVPIGLVVDINPPASSISLRDTGTTNARAKIGVTMPHPVWYEVTSTTAVIRLAPDPAAALADVVPPIDKKKAVVKGLSMGNLHVTVEVRRTKTF